MPRNLKYISSASRKLRMEISVLHYDDDDDLFPPNSTVLSLNRRRYYTLLVSSLRVSLASSPVHHGLFCVLQI